MTSDTTEAICIPYQVGCHYGFTLRLRSWLDAVQVHQFKIEFHGLMYNWWLPRHWSHHYNSSQVNMIQQQRTGLWGYDSCFEFLDGFFCWGILGIERLSVASVAQCCKRYYSLWLNCVARYNFDDKFSCHILQNGIFFIHQIYICIQHYWEMWNITNIYSPQKYHNFWTSDHQKTKI